MTGVKWLVLLIFFAIVLSLVSAMVHLVHDYKGETRRMVRALSVRLHWYNHLTLVLGTLPAFEQREGHRRVHCWPDQSVSM